MRRSERGHHTVPHTADVILEAWGPDLASCCEEAVAGLAALYVDATDWEATERLQVHLAPGDHDEMLLDLLQEVIFTLDTSSGVPVAAGVAAASDGGLDVEIVLTDPATVVATGAVPKAVSLSELAVQSEPGRMRCRFLVDV